MKILVLDTSVLISALFWKGNPQKILKKIEEGRYILLSSKDIEVELIRVLGYKKFNLELRDVAEIMNRYRDIIKEVDIVSDIKMISEDIADNVFLECAKDGGADYIISSDKHILKLKEFEGIPILTPREFLEREGLLRL